MNLKDSREGVCEGIIGRRKKGRIVVIKLILNKTKLQDS